MQNGLHVLYVDILYPGCVFSCDFHDWIDHDYRDISKTALRLLFYSIEHCLQVLDTKSLQVIKQFILFACSK